MSTPQTTKQSPTTPQETAVLTMISPLQHQGHSFAGICPYHTPLIRLQPQGELTANMKPMQRFLSMAAGDHPVSLTGNTRVGTSLSAGCTCGQISRDVMEALTRIAILGLSSDAPRELSCDIGADMSPP
ncbi:hypothetical protein EJ04DRAFT_562407 [Polyplosphaeria fusca]|uniref:Uncharacterized protein n=1 Tax=Polyplosphaeria fusca TaxID=682080 RepID=A0A9P4R4H3_9PLEO|nr:hypothetical protein EJ04DRAFT_562407 [Polyplosphaeria fusca]